MRERPNEVAAAALLASWLKGRGYDPVRWERGANPPDFVFTAGTEQWAVEVTRADQRVRSADGGRSRSADTKLMAFGEAIAVKQRLRLTRPYTLTLRPKPGVTDTKAWKDKARKAIIAAIENDGKGPLLIDAGGRTASKGFEMGDVEGCAELRGYEANEGGAENRIFVIIDASRASTPEGHAPYDIAANQEESIRYALENKAAKLTNVAGFDKVALVLINVYLFNEAKDAEAIAERLVPAYGVFDVVFFINDLAIHRIYER